MKVVIQCAGDKDDGAATLCQNGQELRFVARPVPGTNQRSPWQRVTGSNGPTWIECLRSFNDAPQRNLPQGVAWGRGTPTRAADLYSNPIYQRLACAIGVANVYILSAGWGLVRGTDVIPTYNITFSAGQNVPPHARITPKDRVPLGNLRNGVEGDDQIHLFLTPKYISYWLNAGLIIKPNRLVLHWRAGQALPDGLGNVERITFETDARMNWHYGAADEFLDGIH